jgi:hypothetical protein
LKLLLAMALALFHIEVAVGDEDVAVGIETRKSPKVWTAMTAPGTGSCPLDWVFIPTNQKY